MYACVKWARSDSRGFQWLTQEWPEPECTSTEGTQPCSALLMCHQKHWFIWMQHLGRIIAQASLVAQRLKRLPPMWETWVRSLGWEDPLEKEMVTHSSILAWRIPWMDKPGRLQSTGSQRVGHDWATSLSLSFIVQKDHVQQLTSLSIWWRWHSDSSAGKESSCNAGDLGSIPGLGRSPADGNGSHSSVLAWRIPWTV